MFDSLRSVARGTWLRTVLVVAVTTAVVAPTAVWAADRFIDVPDSNVFSDDITWLAENGVTMGCNPPANDMFCPSENVTREQMAAFMRRLAEGRVVDAATANVAMTAGDADTLDGIDSTAFLTSVDTTYVRDLSALDSTSSKWLEVTCPTGYIATGGGALAYRMDGGDESDLVIRGSTPTFSGSPQQPVGWIAFAEEAVPVAGDWYLSVTVLCLVAG